MFRLIFILLFLLPQLSYSNKLKKHPKLKKVTKDGVYIYGDSGNFSSKSGNISYSFHGGAYNPKKLSIEGTDFSSLYNTSKISPLVFFDFNLLTKPFVVGRIGLNLSLGCYVNVYGTAKENLKTEKTSQSKTDSDNEEEVINVQAETPIFYAFPVFVGLTYRLQIWPDQFIFPFIEAGIGAVAYYELDSQPNYSHSYLSYLGGGVALSMNKFGDTLSAEYGLSSFYLFVNVRKFMFVKVKDQSSTDYDFSSPDNIAESFISAGIMLDY